MHLKMKAEVLQKTLELLKQGVINQDLISDEDFAAAIERRETLILVPL